jgi:hypothetical protein
MVKRSGFDVIGLPALPARPANVPQFGLPAARRR